MKGQIEIVAEKQVVFKDTRVDSTQAQLLDKLKIYPFEYKMRVLKILQDGNIFDSAVLDLSMDMILAKFRKAVHNLTCVSLGAGVPTKVSAPHSLLNGFKSLVAAAASSGYSFAQGDAVLAAAATAPKSPTDVPEDPSPTKTVEEEKTVTEEPAEEVVDLEGLFGKDEYGDY